MEFLGYNPLKDAIDLRLKGDYVTTNRVDSISAFLAEKPFVSEMVFDRPLVNLLNENIERARVLLLACCLFFLALSIILIHNSIRLSIYAKRMIIKTMQLVGARKRFIRGPFIRTYLLLGMISALIACLGVWALVINAQTYLPGIDLFAPLDSSVGLRHGAYTEWRKGVSLRTERYRITRWGKEGALGWEFYDHDTDSLELYNSAPEASRTPLFDSLSQILNHVASTHQIVPSAAGEVNQNAEPLPRTPPFVKHPQLKAQ